MTGSSPLTRGKRREGRHGLFARGLIPAHAGKTPAFSWASPGLWAHPRSRGENWRGRRWRCRRWGSSPLTRGKPVSRRVMTSPRGLIPAHAGKTLRPWWRRGSRGAHPRSRGENAEGRGHIAHTTGSSPLTRGKRDVQPPRSVHEGLIPAHAGKTARDACAPR